MKNILLICMAFLCASMVAQTTTIEGRVIDMYGVPLPLANVKLRGNPESTTTDFDGMFSLSIDYELPVTLIFSSVGFETVALDVTSIDQEILVTLKEGTELDIVIVSASRAPERIFESPVSVEYYSGSEIKSTPSIDFYSGLENIKGVEVNSSSLTYKAVNTRGYGGFTNPRFVQLIDGMDNSYPSLNTTLGNLIGISELDVNSIELLPGASSALYGANAFNGILFIKGKSPFTYQGISAYVKTGATSQEAAGSNSFVDVGVRLAKAFSDKFAVKTNLTYFKGTDWFAVNEDNLNNPNLDRANDPNYNGVNVYGDEVSFNIPGIGEVSRTGYREQDLVDYNAENFKFSGSMHYKPAGDDLEIIYQGKIGAGSVLFQNTNRFYAPNYLFQQHKLELKNDHFFVRGYVSAGDSRRTYDTRIAAINLNNRWKDNATWFTDYATAYGGEIAGGAAQLDAHRAARVAANNGRLEPGTQAFDTALNEIIEDSDFTTGANFNDKTQIRHLDVNYNLSSLTNNFADIQLGGSYRQHRLRSFGTVFTDFDEAIVYGELAMYTQLQKKFIDDRLKFTGSVRYDKSELFAGNLSPRLALGYTMGEKRNHNIRMSYQTGFRNPTIQNLYLGLDLAGAIAVGTAKDNLDREVRTFNLSTAGEAVIGASRVTVPGRAAIENSFSVASVRAFSSTGDVSQLSAANPSLVKPEKVTTIDIGYRGTIKDLTLELNAYFNQYNNFINSENVLVPLYGIVGTPEAALALSNGDVKEKVQVSYHQKILIFNHSLTPRSIELKYFLETKNCLETSDLTLV